MLMPAGASPASGQDERQRIFLTFARDEDIINIDDSDEFEKSKNRKRQILLGNCRLLDQKLEKPGNFEITAPQGVSKFKLILIFIICRFLTSILSAITLKAQSLEGKNN